MNGRSLQKITVPGCKGLPLGSTNLLCCLVQGKSTSIHLSCWEIGAGELGYGVSETVGLLLSECILLVTGVATDAWGIVAELTGMFVAVL